MRARGAAGHKTMNSMKAKWLLTLLSGTGAGIYPVVSAALGLGDIQIDSRLNQSLRARIEIVGVSDEEWRLIRANIAAQTLANADVVHPELLDSVTLTPVEDANHRHFIQVKSSSVFTEPLFDLPIEVSDPSAHVVRSYAVMLDPEEVSTPPKVADGGLAVAGVTAAQPAQVDSAAVASKAAAPQGTATKRHAGRRHGKRGSKHARSRHHAPSAAPTSSLASSSGAPPSNTAERTNTQAVGSAKDQLERQLAMLQQTLAQMQATIAAQDAEIAKLTRAVEGGTPATETSAARPTQQAVAAAAPGTAASGVAAPGTVAPAASASATVAHDAVSSAPVAQSSRDATAAAGSRSPTPATQADSDDYTADDTEPPSFWVRHKWVSRVAAGLGLTALLGATALWLVRRRKAAAERDVAMEDRYGVSQKDPPKKSYQTAQAASYQVEEHSQGSDVGRATPAAVSSAQDDQDGMESWLAQTALLEQDVLSATGSLPAVTEEAAPEEKSAVKATRAPTGSSAASDDDRTLELQQTLESLEMQQTLESLEMQQTLEVQRPLDAQQTVEMRRALNSLSLNGPDSSENRDVVKELEHTLDIEPGRVDLQLKLLEIYHHEALGNRDNFHLLLSRLKVEQETLSPAQRSHLEMLRRTLEDGKADADAQYTEEAAL